MANTKQAKKRAIQSEKRRKHNVSQRSMMRTIIKKVRQAVEEKDLEKAQAAFKDAIKIIDRMVNKTFIHKNTAARYKSRLNKNIKALG